ncbi:hypothetical protein CC2G_004166 [Coprinopsis cinerea AmutBmut pab1-1]|nr:hypothetical protein CC2G_004166 [Coprinopsis cinerea AmutBmut pab1-1]
MNRPPLHIPPCRWTTPKTQMQFFGFALALVVILLKAPYLFPPLRTFDLMPYLSLLSPAFGSSTHAAMIACAHDHYIPSLPTCFRAHHHPMLSTTHALEILIRGLDRIGRLDTPLDTADPDYQGLQVSTWI